MNPEVPYPRKETNPSQRACRLSLYSSLAGLDVLLNKGSTEAPGCFTARAP